MAEFLKKGKTINSQAREVIANVIAFMFKESESGVPIIPLKHFKQRVLEATGISASSFDRINKERKEIESGVATKFRSPRKNDSASSPKCVLPDGEEEVIRRIIYDFAILQKRRPSLRALLACLRERDVAFQGQLMTLRKLLILMGFRWISAPDKRQQLCESFDIRRKRILYLRNMAKYRQEGRPIIYLDETYCHSSHTQTKDWIDNSGKGLKRPIGKGKRLIVAHAGSSNGFISNALLIFTSGIKSGDYHDEMNFENFSKWMSNQEIPNMPANSVVVLDNASYHNCIADKPPTASSRKRDMIEWLEEKGIAHEPHLTKVELYELIKLNKGEISYKLDQLLQPYGHVVLRLPPYHPELNPIEKIWALAKNHVATYNVTFRLSDVEVLLRQKFSSIGVAEWASVCDHVCRIELEYMEKEHIMEHMEDELCFQINGSESETDSDDDGGLT